MFKPRQYQSDGIQKCKHSLRKGNKKILMALGTGGGKSVIVRLLFEMALKKNPNAKLLYIVHRTLLINQMKETLKGLNVDIYTLQKAGREETITYDLILSDEVHFGHGSKLMNNLRYKFFIGVSATPITPDGYALDGFDDVIDVAQLIDLIKWGFMPPLKVLSTPKVDVKGLKVQRGDFNPKESYELMSKSEITKDLVKSYETHAKGLKTIIYCVNVEHSEEVAKEFRDNGYSCEAVHSKTDKTAVEKFRNNEIQILTNCEVLTTGLDMPDIYCLMLASPTKSYIKAVQIYGRLRLNPNDKDKVGLILDCSRVVESTQHPYQRLDINKVKTASKKPTCKCGGELETIEKQIKDKTALSYTLVTYRRCKSCKEVTIQEEMKVIELVQCDNCLKVIDKNIEMSMKDKKLEFVYKCDCGFEKVQREIVLTDQELKEIEYNEIMQTETWERVKKMLLASCKRCGYNHRYSVRLIEYMQDRGISVKDAISAIEDLDSKGYKISKLMYGHFQ